MAKFLCACGATIRTSGDIPHPHEWLLVADADIGDDDPSFSTIYASERTVHAFKCASCGRLWVYWNGFGEPPQRYDPG
jgi:hypothetical protein